MFNLMPFALEEKGRGYFHWSSTETGLSDVDVSRIPGSFYSPWGAGGRVICQPVRREFPMAWLQEFQPGRNCKSVQLHSVEDHLTLVYVLAGTLALKCRYGASMLGPGAWQFLPGNLPEIELQVYSTTRLLFLAISHDQLRCYQGSLPDLTEWLMAPTFYAWHDKQKGGELQEIINETAGNLATAGWRMPLDRLWECYDRMLLFAMGHLGVSLSAAGCDPEDPCCHAALVSRIRVSLLVAIPKSSPPPLSQLAMAAAHCGRTLQKIFKAHFGLSMMEYFIGARMEAILRQIIWTEKPLQIIALEFGYQDYSTFSNAVRRWWAVSPRVLRKSRILPARSVKLKRHLVRRPEVRSENLR